MARHHEVWTGMVDDLDEHHMARDHEVGTGMVDDLDEHHILDWRRVLPAGPSKY